MTRTVWSLLFVLLEPKRFFAACDSETWLRYLFFLDTGCREREVMFACQDDFNFESEDSEFASTYEIRPKDDLGFKTKKGKTRIVPLTPRLAQKNRAASAFLPLIVHFRARKSRRARVKHE
jgi:integrase